MPEVSLGNDMGNATEPRIKPLASCVSCSDCSLRPYGCMLVVDYMCPLGDRYSKETRSSDQRCSSICRHCSWFPRFSHYSRIDHGKFREWWRCSNRRGGAFRGAGSRCWRCRLGFVQATTWGAFDRLVVTTLHITEFSEQALS